MRAAHPTDAAAAAGSKVVVAGSTAFESKWCTCSRNALTMLSAGAVSLQMGHRCCLSELKMSHSGGRDRKMQAVGKNGLQIVAQCCSEWR